MKLLWQFFRDLKSKCDKYYLLSIFVIAQNSTSRQYRDSVLGVVWTLIQPTTQILIYSIIMPHIMRFPVQNYTLYLVTSIFTWNFISQSLICSTGSLINNAETIKRCLVSKTVFPLAEVLRLLYNYLVSFASMYCIFLLLGFAQFSWTIFILPIYIAALFMVLASVAIACSFVAPYLRDLTEIITVGTNISFWLTPIVYPLEAVPERFHWLFEFNPFYILIRPIARITYHHQLPSMMENVSLLILMMISAFVSYLIYKACRKNFILYL